MLEAAVCALNQTNVVLLTFGQSGLAMNSNFECQLFEMCRQSQWTQESSLWWMLVDLLTSHLYCHLDAGCLFEFINLWMRKNFWLFWRQHSIASSDFALKYSSGCLGLGRLFFGSMDYLVRFFFWPSSYSMVPSAGSFQKTCFLIVSWTAIIALL